MKFTVNGLEKETVLNALSFIEIVRLSLAPEPPYASEFTVTVREKGGHGRELIFNQEVILKEGMIFNAVHTGGA